MGPSSCGKTGLAPCRQCSCPFLLFFFSVFCFSLFSLGVGQIEPWSSHLQKLFSRPKIKHPNSKIKKYQNPKNPKSRLQNHLQNTIEQVPYKKKHNFITEFRPATSLQNSIAPTKWLPQGSESSKRNCYKTTIFGWHKIRPYKLDFYCKLIGAWS